MNDRTGMAQRRNEVERMNITPEELARILAAAVGDMLGDSKALDEMGPSSVIFRLCRELERLDREADVLSIWLANDYYIDINLMTKIESGRMNPPLPKDVREAARKAVAGRRRMMSEELMLLPCPACGGRAWAHYDPTTIRIYCPCCDILGPKKDTIEEARAAWNALSRAMTWRTEPRLGAWN